MTNKSTPDLTVLVFGTEQPLEGHVGPAPVGPAQVVAGSVLGAEPAVSGGACPAASPAAAAIHLVADVVVVAVRVHGQRGANQGEDGEGVGALLGAQGEAGEEIDQKN